MHTWNSPEALILRVKSHVCLDMIQMSTDHQHVLSCLAMHSSTWIPVTVGL
jgi:hypothetical protein